MSRLSEEKYTEIVNKVANNINKRMSWVEEMKKMEQYKPFTLTTTQSPFFKHNVDLRDIYSLSTLLPLRGESEAEQKKNFQDDVHKMYRSFLDGPLTEVGKYLDKLIDLQFNYDETKLDYSKEEDVYKAISVSTLDQCIGTEKENFKYYYNSKINTKELKEKFYYRNIALHQQNQGVFTDVEKRVHLNIGVTIKPVDFSFDKTYTNNRNNVNERDLKQVELSLQNKDEVANLEYIVNKSYANVLKPENTVAKIYNDTSVSLGVEFLFQDIVLPGNTEGKPEIEAFGFTFHDVVFINGKPLSEAYKGSRFDVSKENDQRKMVAYLTEQLTNPDSIIEVCKLIPIGENKFKNQFITVHKNFSDYNPSLQAQYDEAYNAYIAEGYKEHRDAEIKHVAKVFDNIKTKEVKQALEKAEKIPTEAKEGVRPDYKDYDPFFKNNAITQNALTRLENVFNVGNKFNQILPVSDKEHLSTIEERQGLGMAMLMAGKNASIEDIYKKRFELFNAYKAGGEFKKEFNRQFINKVLAYDFTKARADSENDYYEYLTFVFASSAVSNIFEEDKELEQEFNSNPITKNAIALKAAYTNGVSEFLGGKMIERMNGIASNSFTVHHFDNISDTDAATLWVLEAKRILFDVTNAKADSLTNGNNGHTLTVPYFLTGNACGSEGEYYSIDQSNKTFDDYINCYSVVDNELSADGTLVSEANIDLLTVGTGNSLFNAIANQNQTSNKDNVAEFAEANDLSNHELTELSAYIDNVSLKDLIDSKYDSVISSKGLNPNEIHDKESKHIREAISSCLLAEAMANPQKNISVVFLKSNENNVLEPTTTLLKKNYKPMIENARNQHTTLEKILHFFHLKTYDEERVAKISKKAISDYRKSNQSNAITDAFKEKNKVFLLRHQANYAVTKELMKDASSELNKYEEKTFKNIKESFLNEMVEDQKTAKTTDDVEAKNNNNKLKISIDIDEKDNTIENLPSNEENTNDININELDNNEIGN